MHLLTYLPRFRKAYQEMEALAARENWSRAEIEAFQLERLNAVWQHARSSVPYYRKLAAEQELPPRFSSLEEFSALVPVLAKTRVRAEPLMFLSEQVPRGTWRRTGGCTGAPMSVYWGREAALEMLRTMYRALAAWNVDIFDRRVLLWGHSATLAPGFAGRAARLRQPLEDKLRNRLRLSAYDLGHNDLHRYLRQIAAFRPASIYGYSKALYLLAGEAETIDFHCDSLKLFTLTGEPALPFIVEKIERIFGVPAVVEYGAIECGVMASEYPDRKLRVREDTLMLETLPQENGRFEIVVTMFCNPCFPLLRYSIADVTDAPLERPARGFAILMNVAGRNNDFVLTRTGRYLHSARFDALLKYHSQAIRGFHVRQRADGSLHVQLEIDGPRDALDVDRLQREIRDLVEGYPVKVEFVDKIPQTAAGKHRLVMSQLVHPSLAGLRTSTIAVAPPQNPTPASSNGSAATSGSAASGGVAAGGVAAGGVAPGGVAPGSVAPGSVAPGSVAAGSATSGSAAPASTNGLACGSLRLRASAERPAAAFAPFQKAAQLRNLIYRPGLSFIMEAHNGLSAKIVEEAGFEAIWASGLAISAALGVRDSNEASWTQVLEVLEFMSDATRIPILVDGDTGYGNFNNMRRLVQKLEQRGIGGVCIEDKVFPKTNSFLRGAAQPLADMEEFCGRIAAGKDAQRSDDFVIIARVEALIAGWGMEEALKRAEAYRRAGADAILIHSAQRSPKEVIAFKQIWGDRLPVVIVPTKYYATPTEVFRTHNFAAVIWANHLMRCCVTAMQRTVQEIFEDQSLINVEDRVAPLAEVFRLQGDRELAEAEKRYLPCNAASTRAIVLAASRGIELGEMTENRPKCMVAISGAPILARIANTYRAAGIRDLSVVRGYKKEAVDLPGMTYYDNDDPSSGGHVYSLYRAIEALEGGCIISYGDVLFKRHVAEQLMETEGDFVVAVDIDWQESRNRGRYADYVTCSEDCPRKSFYNPARLLNISGDIGPGEIHGEWMGFLKVSAAGAAFLRELLTQLAADQATLKSMKMADLLRRVLQAGKEIRVILSAGQWHDIDSIDDVLAGSDFQ